MADVIVFANQKGGVGKTITISATASILHSEGYKVLMIDQDAQRNLDMVAGDNIAIPRKTNEGKSILSVMEGECTLREAIVPTNIGDLVRATNRLYRWQGAPVITEDDAAALHRVSVALKRIKDNSPSGSLTPDDLALFSSSVSGLEAVDRQISERFNKKRRGDVHILEDALDDVLDDYDYILIDTNPTLTLLTLNSLYAAQFVVIPAFSERSSAEAIVELYETIRDIKRNDSGRHLAIAGVLMTKYDPRSRAGKRHNVRFSNLCSQLQIPLFETKIRSSARAAEYVEAGQDIYTYAPDSTTAQDYVAFTKELRQSIKTIREGW